MYRPVYSVQNQLNNCVVNNGLIRWKILSTAQNSAKLISMLFVKYPAIAGSVMLVNLALCKMSDYRLIQEFEEKYKAREIDPDHSKENRQLMIPARPKIVYVNRQPVGCVDLNKPNGTIDGYVQLYYLYIYPSQTRNGYATQIMSEICRLADLHSVEIDLDAIPLKGFATTIPLLELRRFYQKFGFKLSEIRGSNLMTRLPNA